LQSVRFQEKVWIRSDGSVEDEGALGLADVVASDGLFAELGNEVRTVVDLQRLTLSLKQVT
jgi:hypothetical protein